MRDSRHRWTAAFLVFLGSWISGFFIIVTDAWMQHPVAYRVLANGAYEVTSIWNLLQNRWALLQYAHNMSGAVIAGAFVMGCNRGIPWRLNGDVSAAAM
ncbi:MAG: cytochrome ubiquinol oxidase subunit I [Acidobacteriaceae bacterium]